MNLNKQTLHKINSNQKSTKTQELMRRFCRYERVTPNHNAVIVQLTKHGHALTMRVRLRSTTEDLVVAFLLLSLSSLPPQTDNHVHGTGGMTSAL
jgi:hypothetical protein